VATPSPASSSSATVRPVIASTSETIGPVTAGPSPVDQPVSVAVSCRSAMRFFAPMIRFEPA